MLAKTLSYWSVKKKAFSTYKVIIAILGTKTIQYGGDRAPGGQSRIYQETLENVWEI